MFLHSSLPPSLSLLFLSPYTFLSLYTSLSPCTILYISFANRQFWDLTWLYFKVGKSTWVSTKLLFSTLHRPSFIFVYSLSAEGRQIGQGDEICIYWPWRLLNCKSLVSVIFTSSYCLLTSANSSVDSQKRKTVSSIVVATTSCPCTGDISHTPLYPEYKGVYAYLCQWIRFFSLRCCLVVLFNVV